MLSMFIFAFLGTIFASFLGGLVRMIAPKLKREILVFIQNFSIGALLSFLFLDLALEANEELFLYFENNIYSSLVICGVCLVVGVLFFLLHEVLHRFSHHHDEDEEDKLACEDHGHTNEFFKEDKSLFINSLIFLVAISIHNIPEGLALGISFKDSGDTFFNEGLIMSIVLFLHNFIIGFTMFNSFKSNNKSNGFSLVMVLGQAILSYVLAIIGYFVSSISMNPLFNGIIFSLSLGSLLYVLFIELLPQTYYSYKSRFTFIYIILGFCVFSLILAI